MAMSLLPADGSGFNPIRIIGTNRWPLESHAMQRALTLVQTCVCILSLRTQDGTLSVRWVLDDQLAAGFVDVRELADVRMSREAEARHPWGQKRGSWRIASRFI